MVRPGDQDGLVYLCNSVSTDYATIPPSTTIKDFFVDEGGSIRRHQMDEDTEGNPLPAGNTFSGSVSRGYSFQNLGPEINYLYFEGDSAQYPGTAAIAPEGLTLASTIEPNVNCKGNAPSSTPDDGFRKPGPGT